MQKESKKANQSDNLFAAFDRANLRWGHEASLPDWHEAIKLVSMYKYQRQLFLELTLASFSPLICRLRGDRSTRSNESASPPVSRRTTIRALLAQVAFETPGSELVARRGMVSRRSSVEYVSLLSVLLPTKTRPER